MDNLCGNCGRPKVETENQLACNCQCGAAAYQKPYTGTTTAYRMAFWDGALWALENHPSGTEYTWHRFAFELDNYLKTLNA